MIFDRSETRLLCQEYLAKGGLAAHLAVITPGDALELINALDRAERSLHRMGATDQGGEHWQVADGTPLVAITAETAPFTEQIQVLKVKILEDEIALLKKDRDEWKRTAEELSQDNGLRTVAELPVKKAAVAITGKRHRSWILNYLQEHGASMVEDLVKARGTTPGAVRVALRMSSKHIDHDGKRPRTYWLKGMAPERVIASPNTLEPEVVGTEEYAICGRDGCVGMIIFTEPVNCSCQISPPCSACVAVHLHCPVCDWEAESA